MGVWRELILELPAHQVERWSDALLEAGALSVQAEDADAESPDEQPLFGEPGLPVAQAGWVRTRLTALLAEQADPPSVLAAAAAALDESGPLPAFELRELADRDWVSASQAQFEPIPVGARLLITPTWHLDAERARGQDAGREIIVLDPGLAFGTGSHPTTHMCLLWLSEQLHPGQSVIDYGCGSGILAIAAAKFGGTPVCGIDIDPQAVDSARDNALANAVELDLRTTAQPLPPPADVVVANILANPLKVLAPVLAALVRPGGALILAGLLDRQAEEVAACYPAIALTPYASLEGWTCLAGRRV
jgi:ribosomal protein L11 methyltransferase